METQENTVGKLSPLNPFSVIPFEANHRVKIWDFNLEVYDHPATAKIVTGRVRILALVPKKPQPLENIKFSVAWCAPSDAKRFDKSKANKILIGRFLKHFQDGHANNNCAVIAKLESLKEFQLEAFNALESIPRWAQDPIRIIQRTSELDIFFDDETNKTYTLIDYCREHNLLNPDDKTQE